MDCREVAGYVVSFVILGTNLGLKLLLKQRTGFWIKKTRFRFMSFASPNEIDSKRKERQRCHERLSLQLGITMSMFKRILIIEPVVTKIRSTGYH